MVFAIRHGVLGYEAMGLNRLFLNLPFGVFIYEATRAGETRRYFCRLGAGLVVKCGAAR